MEGKGRCRVGNKGRDSSLEGTLLFLSVFFLVWFLRYADVRNCRLSRLRLRADDDGPNMAASGMRGDWGLDIRRKHESEPVSETAREIGRSGANGVRDRRGGIGRDSIERRIGGIDPSVTFALLAPKPKLMALF